MNRLLFDPPEVYDLPLSYGSDIKVDFRNVIPDPTRSPSSIIRLA